MPRENKKSKEKSLGKGKKNEKETKKKDRGKKEERKTSDKEEDNSVVTKDSLSL